MSSGMEGAVSCPVHTHTASNLSYLVTFSVTSTGTSPSPGLLCGRLDFFVDFFGESTTVSVSIANSKPPRSVSTQDNTSQPSRMRSFSSNVPTKDRRYSSVCSCPKARS